MIREAAVDTRGRRWIISSYSQTTAGFWIANDWFTILDAPENELVGRAVLEALARSEQDVRTPEPGEPLPIEPILAELGLKSLRDYMRGARSVWLRQDSNGIEINPTENQGARDGFVEIAGTAAQLDPDQMQDPIAVGEAVRRTVDIAR